MHPILETSNQNHNKMKRFLTFLLAVIFAPVLTMNLMAAKTEKQWNFELNDEGECIIEHVFTTSKADGEAAMKAFKKAMNKQTFESRSVISEEPGQSIHYALTKNTKSRYNPFAGNFREAMKFKMDVTYRDGKIYVKLYDLSLENEYEGYGKNVRSETFSGKIAEYEGTMMNPYVAASRGYVDDVIIPADTRKKLIKAFKALEGKQQEAPFKKHGNIPL